MNNEELETLTNQAAHLERETHLLRIETAKKLRRTTKEFRVLFGMIVVLLVVVVAMTTSSLSQSQDNREILERVQSVTDPDGQFNLESRERTRVLVEGLVEQQNQNTERILERLDELEN